METELLNHLKELRSDNAATSERLRAEQARDEREKADIAATVRVFTSYWEKHHPGEPVPPEISGVQPQAAAPPPLSTGGTNLEELLKRSMLTAVTQVPVRFTTKDFFPLVPEILEGDASESQGYDFLRRLVEEGKLWVFQQGAGRRRTTYSKEPISQTRQAIHNHIEDAEEVYAGALERGVVQPLTQSPA